MVIPLSHSFFGCGELRRVLETCYESCSCKVLVYVLWMSLISYIDSILRDVVSGLVTYLTLSFAV